MTIHLWWHDEGIYDYACPWAMRTMSKPEIPPKECTCVDESYQPLPGRWRAFHETTDCTLPDSIQEALNSGDGTYRP